MERNYRLRVHWAVVYDGINRQAQRPDVDSGSGTVGQWKGGHGVGEGGGAARELQRVNLCDL